jgi:asparagine synthase (glutamine-hydrolysing)
MCGIAGVFAYADAASSVDAGELLRMRDAMKSRGPDGEGLWLSPSGRAGLAHRRLAVIDLAATGAQPMVSHDGALRIVFNGEIYNYRELRRQLEQEGCRLRSQSDTEVLLELYARHGASMLTRLRGMFAFAIWDSRSESFFLARDAFGIKPLYIANNGATLRFASQVQALMASGAILATEEAAGYVGFLMWGFVPEPFTLFREIRAVPAGTWLRIERGGREQAGTFFALREEILAAEADSLSPDRDEADVIRHALSDTIEHHLVSDVPVGLFLSSGVDSCVVAKLASEKVGGNLHSLTLGFSEFKNTGNDETVLAARVAADLGIKHSTCWTSRDEVAAALPQFLESMDQPSMDGLNTWLVSRAAANAGIKVALSGLGGDEVFAGYPSFTQVPRMARWLRRAGGHARLSRTLRRLVEPMLAPFASPKYAGLAEYGHTMSGAYLLRRALYMPWELERVFSPAFLKRGLLDLETTSRLAQCVMGVRSERLTVSALELEWYLRSQLLRDADWAGMAHSIEIRVPFVDVPLFRTVARLVAHDRAPAKKDLLESVDGSLPTILATRPKTGFNVPIRAWFGATAGQGASERGLRPWAKHVLHKWPMPPGAERFPALQPGAPRKAEVQH